MSNKKINVITFLCRNIKNKPLSFEEMFNIIYLDEGIKPFYIVTMVNTIMSNDDKFKLRLYIIRNKASNQKEEGIIVADQEFTKKKLEEDNNKTFVTDFTFATVKLEAFSFPSPGEYKVVACWLNEEYQNVMKNDTLYVPKDSIASTFDFKVI